MARTIKEIEVEDKKINALFDTGSTNSYISKNFAPPDRRKLKKPFTVGLGGEIKEIKEICIIEGKIEGLDFSTQAFVIDEIGEVDGKKVEMIIGAITMEQWEISIINMKTGELDLTGLKRREFREF